MRKYRAFCAFYLPLLASAFNICYLNTIEHICEYMVKYSLCKLFTVEFLSWEHFEIGCSLICLHLPLSQKKTNNSYLIILEMHLSSYLYLRLCKIMKCRARSCSPMGVSGPKIYWLCQQFQEILWWIECARGHHFLRQLHTKGSNWWEHSKAMCFLNAHKSKESIAKNKKNVANNEAAF